MAKRKKEYQKLFPSIIFMSILFMSIGYAIINSVILNLTGELIAQNQTGIFITEAKYVSNNNADTTNSKIIQAYKTMLNSDIRLSSTDATSSITYQISIYNQTSINQLFDGVSYSYGQDTYSNEDIIFSLSNLKIGDKLESGQSITFNITFSYKNKILAKSPNLFSYINFNFKVDPTPLQSFDYTGTSQIFTAPETGIYQLETWGAQGGSYSTYYGGYGTYATGEIKLNKGEKIYIYVGGAGSSTDVYNATIDGGFNGGGKATGWWASSNAGLNNEVKEAGGGATHIATKDDYIYNLTSNDLLIVSAGGSGAIYFKHIENYAYCQGGNGGGIEGNIGECESSLMYALNGYTVPTQSAPGTSTYATAARTGAYGKGGDGYSGGGGGYYGGSGGYLASSGGSSYIGNTRLTNKKMVCNNCTESYIAETRTITTTQHSSTPTSNIPKEGNGYAKISIISSIEEAEKGIQIKSIEYLNSTNVDTTKAQIISYSNNIIQSNIDLSLSAANSSITYKVTVVNNDDINYYYHGLVYDLGSDTYSNEGITVTATNVALDETIPPNSTKTIYLQYSYKNGTIASNNNLKSFIQISFLEAICPRDGRICDLSGNNHHLNIVGATWNRYKGEITTDGIDDYLYLDLLDFQGSNQFTLEFVGLLPQQTYNGRGIMLFETSINSNDNYGSFYLDTFEYGINDFTLAMKYGQYIHHKTSNEIIDTSKYRHYTITFNSLNGMDNFIKMYLDASPRTLTTPITTNSDLTGYTLSNYPLYIASRAGNEIFAKMQIKEMRIYKVELTQNEIKENYNGNIKKDNLIASYNFK